MTSNLEAIVAFLAGRDGEDAERIRREVANPESAASQFLLVNRDLSAHLFGEYVTQWLGIPSEGLAPVQDLPQAKPSSPVIRKILRAAPWAVSTAALLVAVLLWLDCRKHRKHLEEALEAALAKPKEKERVVAVAIPYLPKGASPKTGSVNHLEPQKAPVHEPPIPPASAAQGEGNPTSTTAPLSLPTEKLAMPTPVGPNVEPLKPAQIEVPQVVGHSYVDAKKLVESAGLMLRTADIPGSGLISRQVPSAGTSVPSGSTVVVFLYPKSQPEPRVQVPDVCGIVGSDKARALLKQAGLEFAGYIMADGGRVLVAPPTYNQLAQAKIVQQIPAARTTATPGTVVVCIFEHAKKNAPQSIAVPNIIGKTQAEAERALSDAGLTMKALNGAANARAINQSPSAGAMVKPGECITVDFQAKKAGGK
jgi:beta-lactam-binding protein with PASTA domain